MRVGRDLGLPNLVVLVVVFVVFPAIGFIIRRKWRHAAARREEIKRLLIFASEEAARAEIEATEGYLHTSDVSSSFPSSDSTWIPASKSAWIPIPSTASVSVAPSSKPPYKCAVCFAPTSTRCAKCKAARYCSGKCQIIHWRQGHKDECRPYVAVKPVKNVSGTFSKQEDGKDLNATSAESGSTFESSSEEYSTFSTPSRSSTETASSSSSDGTSENFMTADSSNNIKPRFSTSFSRVDDGPNGLFFSEPLDFKKSTINGFNKNTNSDSNGSTSSSRVDDGPNGLSFSEPLNFKKSTIEGSNKNTTSASNGSTSSSRVDDGPNGLSFSEPLDFKKSTVKGSIKNTTSASNGSTSSSQVDDGPNGLSFYEPPDFKKSTIDGSKNTTSAPNGSTSSYWVGDDPNRLSFSTPPDFKKSTIDGSNKKISSALNGSTSSYWVDDDANGLSSSEPLDFKKSTIDFSIKNTTSAPNGSTSSSPIKVPYFSKPSTTSSRLYDELDGSNKNTTILDNSAPNGSRSKKSNDEKRCDFPQSMFKETKISSSPTRESISAIPEKSTHAVNTKNVALKSTSRLASQFSKPVTVHEEKNKVSVCSSKQVEHSGGEKNETKKSMQKVVDQPKIPRQCSQHKSTCKGLFSYEMFVKLYNWKQFELKPFGLVNCGNSCYANAVLQCLTHTPPLNAYFLQGLHSKACDKRDWCFTCEFEGIVLKAKNGNTSLSPIRILSHIENIGSSLNHGREEDAHEFLRYAIDTLQSVCLKEAITKATNSLEEETTLIGLTFGGYLKSKIKCMKCGGKSERHERMMDLTVEIEGNIQTLEEALDKFTCTEILDGENKYKCSRCKSYEKAKKKLTLLEAPNVLTIALKRFQSGKFGKLNKSIRFPEVLDMAPYVSGTSDKSPVYRLYGVVVHVDIMNAAFSGHYVCYVKNVENRWFKIDDNRVKEVDVASVLTKGAYMLLYARCWPRAPRILRNLLSRNTQDPKKHKLSSPSFALRSQPWVDHLAIRHRSLEEESSSSSDGSGILSESCSCSTESSNKDSSSVEWDWDRDHEHNSISSSPLWRNLHSNSSDSDTSSSSSSLSSSFPLPLYSSHSTLYHNNDEGRTVICSNSFREVNVDRLGGQPLETSKPALRRSTTRVRSE